MRKRIILWRHGLTEWNKERRFQGHADVPLTDVGMEQAKAAAPILAGLKPDLLVSSDLIRARVTAQALADIADLEVHLDPRLRETDVGVWSGMTISQMQQADGARLAMWEDGEDVRAGGAENRTDVADRMEVALNDWVARLPEGGALVAVTHGGSARAAIGRLLGLEVLQWPIVGGLENCAWSVLEQVHRNDGQVRWRLAEHNAQTLSGPVLDDDPGPTTAW